MSFLFIHFPYFSVMRLLKELFDSSEIFANSGLDVLQSFRFSCALRPATRQTRAGNTISLLQTRAERFCPAWCFFSSPFSLNVAWRSLTGCGRNVMIVEGSVSGVSVGRMVSLWPAITLWLVCHPASGVYVQRACSAAVPLVRLR